MDAFEKILSDALRFTDAKDPKKRMKVYQNVAKAIETVPEQKRELYRTKLAAFIRKFEAELQNAQPQAVPEPKVEAPAPSQYTVPSLDATDPEYGARADIEPPMSAVTPDDLSDVNASGSDIEGPAIRPRKNLLRYLILVAALAAVILLILAAVWYFILNEDGRTRADRTPPKIEQSETTSTVSTSTSEEDKVETIFDITLPKDIAAVSDRLGSDSGDQAVLGKLVEDKKFTIRELTTIFPGPEFPVDPNKTYFMSLEIQSPRRALNSLVINAGLATMDTEGNLQSAKPGPHRFFLHRGRVKGSDFAADGDNFVITGSITGEKNAALDSFLPDTSKARAIIVVRPKEDDAIVIKRVSLIEIQ